MSWLTIITIASAVCVFIAAALFTLAITSPIDEEHE